MNITVIGKKGCTKCSKMTLILQNRGHQINSVYPETIGKINISGTEVNLTEETHYPLYILNNLVVENFKELNQMIVSPTPTIEIHQRPPEIHPRLDEP